MQPLLFAAGAALAVLDPWVSDKGVPRELTARGQGPGRGEPASLPLSGGGAEGGRGLVLRGRQAQGLRRRASVAVARARV